MKDIPKKKQLQFASLPSKKCNNVIPNISVVRCQKLFISIFPSSLYHSTTFVWLTLLFFISLMRRFWKSDKRCLFWISNHCFKLFIEYFWSLLIIFRLKHVRMELWAQWTRIWAKWSNLDVFGQDWSISFHSGWSSGRSQVRSARKIIKFWFSFILVRFSPRNLSLASFDLYWIFLSHF